MGHKIFILTGTIKNEIVPPKQVTIWSGLSFFSPECEWEQNRAFFFPAESPQPLLHHLEHTSKRIAQRIFKWVLDNKIQVILAQNSTALPCHLSMGMGIKRAVEVMEIPVVAHEHDFHWERGDRYKSPHKGIKKIIHETFPLVLPHVRHAVINTYSKNQLKKRFNIESTVVPNVMNFKKPYGRKDTYNKDLLINLSIDSKDIPLFQITRIVRRKGIEVAIDMLHKLDDRRLKLVITGSSADDERKGYYKELLKNIKELKVRDQIIFADKQILRERGVSPRGRKIYSLSDAYAHATACTYFSTYEGFGNAFVECVLAKKPIFVNNYKPVYWPDIGSKGFKTVMLDNNKLTDKALTQMHKILHNKKLQKEIGDYNFELAKKHFSYEVLEEKLTKLFNF